MIAAPEVMELLPQPEPGVSETYGSSEGAGTLVDLVLGADGQIQIVCIEIRMKVALVSMSLSGYEVEFGPNSSVSRVARERRSFDSGAVERSEKTISEGYIQDPASPSWSGHTIKTIESRWTERRGGVIPSLSISSAGDTASKPVDSATDETPEDPRIRDVKVERKGVFATIDVDELQAAIVDLQSGSDDVRKRRTAAIEANPGGYAPPVFFVLGERLFDEGREEDAAFWFYFARLRGRYDAARCADETARSAVATLNDRYGRRIGPWARARMDSYLDRIERVLDLDERTPFDYDHRWINLHGTAAVLAGMGGDEPDADELSVPKDQWPSIRAKTRASVLRRASEKAEAAGRPR